MQTSNARKKPAGVAKKKATKKKAEPKAPAAPPPATAAAKAPKATKKEAKPAAAAKPASGKKPNASEEIDGLFGQLKGGAAKAKAEKEGGDGKGAGDGKGGAAAKPKKVQGSKDDIFGAEAGKGRKRTEEGFAIYGEDELGLGRKGGDTDLCPFDCDCCF